MRKGLAPLITFAVAVVIAALVSVSFLIIFKVKITNSIIYHHKTDNIGHSLNTILSLSGGEYRVMETLGSHIVLRNNIPDDMKPFDEYFKTHINSIFPGQKCLSLLVRNNDNLKIESETVGKPTDGNKGCYESGLNLVQVVSPIALPYHPTNRVKLVSLVTNK